MKEWFATGNSRLANYRRDYLTSEISACRQTQGARNLLQAASRK